MRHTIFALCIVAVSGQAALAQTGPWAEKLFKGHLSHDFGNVPRGAKLSHRFPITNIYAVDLQIVDTRVSCGCATVYPASKVLKSRQTSYVDVVMDARKFTGPKSISVYISVGPEYTSTATLKVTANSRSDVVFNPGQIDFGIVSKGATPKQTVEVEYAGVLDWKITEVANSTPFEVTLSEMYRRSGQVGYKVTVAMKADVPAGEFKHEVQLKTNDKASPVLSVLVEANVQAPLTVAPNVVAMDALKVNEEKAQRVVVRARKPFKIVGIDGVGDGVTVSAPTTAASVHFLTVKCHPTKAGSLKKQLTIRTDLDNNATVSVMVEAKVTE
jgi:hypothetical protein